MSITAKPASLIPGETTFLTINSRDAVFLSLTPNIGSLSCFPAGPGLCPETYQAPIAVTSPVSVTITATSAVDSTKSASVRVTIVPTTSYLYLGYGFLFSGFDASGPVSVAGTLSIDKNGTVIGEEDFKDPTAQNPMPQPITGSCQNFSVTLTGFCRLTAGGITSQYDFALGGTFDLARFVEDPADGSGITGSGILVAQNGQAGQAGGRNTFAFGFVGTNPTSGRMGVVGTITTDVSGRNITAGQSDINDDGVLIQSSATPNVTGSFSQTDNFSRATTQITIGSSPQRTFMLAVYFVSGTPNRAFAIDITPATPTTNAQVLAGQFLFEGTFALPTPTFSNSSISGVDVFGLWGRTTGGAATTAVGTLAPSGTPSVRMDVNVGGNVNGGTGAAVPEIGSMAGLNIASNGRAQFSTSVGGVNSNYVAFLHAANDGFLIGTDANVSFGFLQAQASPPNFSNTTITGNYATGTFLPTTPAVPNVASITTLTPGGQGGATFNGTLSSGSTTGAYSFDSTTGRGTVAAAGGGISGNNSAVFYIIDPGDIVLMGSQQGQPNDAIEFLQL
jgi:hypothetical protein